MVGGPPTHEPRDMSVATTPLLAASLVLLIVTSVTGALTGFELLGTAEDSLHGSAGTLGWLTLGVLATATVLFPGDAVGRRSLARAKALLVWMPIGAMTAYVLASWAASAPVRTAAALFALVATIGFVVGMVPAIRQSAPVTVPQLAVLVGLAILTAGLLLDLVLDVNEIGEADWVPFRVAGARSPSIATFAILVGMALAEWRLAARRRPASTDTWGLAQVLLFVAGWLTLLLGTAVNSLNLLGGNVMFHALAVAVFLGRLAPRLPRVRWSTTNRWFGLLVLYLAAHVGLLGHLALGVTGGRYLELRLVPTWLIFAVDHLVFVGVVANGLLGLGFRMVGPLQRSRAEPAAFWGTNLGLIGFAVGLAGEADVVVRTAAVVMGIGVTLGALACLDGLRPPRRKVGTVAVRR